MPARDGIGRSMCVVEIVKVVRVVRSLGGCSVAVGRVGRCGRRSSSTCARCGSGVAAGLVRLIRAAAGAEVDVVAIVATHNRLGNNVKPFLIRVLAHLVHVVQLVSLHSHLGAAVADQLDGWGAAKACERIGAHAQPRRSILAVLPKVEGPMKIPLDVTNPTRSANVLGTRLGCAQLRLEVAHSSGFVLALDKSKARDVRLRILACLLVFLLKLQRFLARLLALLLHLVRLLGARCCFTSLPVSLCPSLRQLEERSHPSRVHGNRTARGTVQLVQQVAHVYFGTPRPRALCSVLSLSLDDCRVFAPRPAPRRICHLLRVAARRVLAPRPAPCIPCLLARATSTQLRQWCRRVFRSHHHVDVRQQFIWSVHLAPHVTIVAYPAARNPSTALVPRLGARGL